jgi:hypothetical protein
MIAPYAQSGVRSPAARQPGGNGKSTVGVPASPFLNGTSAILLSTMY